MGASLPRSAPAKSRTAQGGSLTYSVASSQGGQALVYGTAGRPLVSHPLSKEQRVRSERGIRQTGLARDRRSRRLGAEGHLVQARLNAADLDAQLVGIVWVQSVDAADLADR